MTIDLGHVKNAASRLNTALLVGHQKLSAGKAFEAWLMLVLLKAFSGTWMSQTNPNDVFIRLNGGRLGGTQNKAGYGAFSHTNPYQSKSVDYEIHNSVRAEGYAAQTQPPPPPRHELDLVIIPTAAGKQSRTLATGKYLQNPDVRVFLELKDYAAAAGIAAARQVCFNRMDIAAANPVAVKSSLQPPPTGILVAVSKIVQSAKHLIAAYQCKCEEYVASGQFPSATHGNLNVHVNPNPLTNLKIQSLQVLIRACL